MALTFDDTHLARIRKGIENLRDRFANAPGWGEVFSSLDRHLLDVLSVESETHSLTQQLAPASAELKAIDNWQPQIPEAVNGPFLADWIGHGGALDQNDWPKVTDDYLESKRKQMRAPVLKRAEELRGAIRATMKRGHAPYRELLREYESAWLKADGRVPPSSVPPASTLRSRCS